MRKKIIALLLAALTVFSAGCTASAPSSADESTPVITAKSKEKRKIIIDTDTAGDDAVVMIIAAKTENVDILGVTVSAGNVELEQAVNNALMTLEIAGCDAPVYKGSADTIDGTVKTAFSVFGTDGMGDADLIHPKKQAEDGDAVDFIIDTVRNNPDEVEIIK